MGWHVNRIGQVAVVVVVVVVAMLAENCPVLQINVGGCEKEALNAAEAPTRQGKNEATARGHAGYARKD